VTTYSVYIGSHTHAAIQGLFVTVSRYARTTACKHEKRRDLLNIYQRFWEEKLLFPSLESWKC